jgi:hypothetical protein
VVRIAKKMDKMVQKKNAVSAAGGRAGGGGRAGPRGSREPPGVESSAWDRLQTRGREGVPAEGAGPRGRRRWAPVLRGPCPPCG